MAINPYSIIPAATHKQFDDRGHITPNFEFSEGIRPAGSFMPAPYLPVVRFNKYFEEHIVLSGGKILAFDSAGFIVPAGLRKEAAAWLNTFLTNAGIDMAADIIAADAGALVVYGSDDAARGVLNAGGVAAVAGEPVVKSFFTPVSQGNATTEVTVSNPIGISPYNYWPHPGGDGTNPTQYNTYNFNLQSKVAFLCDYIVQVPVVADQATYDAAPYSGMGALVGVVKPGEFITYDNYSNFVSLGYELGATDMAEVVGQAQMIDTDFPKDYLDLVRTRYSEFGELEKMPGTATDGKPDVLTYSGGTGLVTINLINR